MSDSSNEGYDDAAGAVGTEDQVIDINTSEGMDFELLEADTEQLFLTINAEYRSGVGANGPWSAINLTLDPSDRANADYVYHMQFLPKNTGDEKKYKKSLFYFNLFKRAFGLAPEESFVASDLVQREVYAVVGTEESPDRGPRNTIKKWIPGDEVGTSGPQY